MPSIHIGRQAAQFTPRMNAQTHGMQLRQPLAYRRFAGAIADYWDITGQSDGGGFYLSPDPRIVVFLDQAPPMMGLKTAARHAAQTGVRAFYIPPGVPLWSQMHGDHRFTHLDIHLEIGALQQRFSRAGRRADLAVPRMLQDGNETLTTIARLTADEVRTGRGGEMMLDGLCNAMLSEIFATGPTPQAQATGGLTPHQLSTLENHLRHNMGRNIPVAEMARIVGLSESWFAHAFRKSCDTTPQRWQSRRRLEAAHDLLHDPALTLATIAHATGFADQAHLSRAFRTTYGMPPSQWRRTILQPG
ncbi:MAG TPA: AraC family transcriptional regulator [Paenirhodobacter sp.]